MNLIQAQQRYIEKMRAIHGSFDKKRAVGARLELCRWATRNDCDPIVVLNDARDMLELELKGESQGQQQP